MLARAIQNKKPEAWTLWAAEENELDITKDTAVQEAVGRFRPELIINCAAFTRVDDCEGKRDLAFAVNGVGPGLLAEAAHGVGARLVHFSTDYIFNGSKKVPYLEDDPAGPVSIYGASKWEGEIQVRKHLQRHLIIRTQWLYGAGGSHFVQTILNLARLRDQLKVVDDQVGSPTWTWDLAEGTLHLIEREAEGTYHLVNDGACSWHRFACQIVEAAGLATQIVPCTTEEFPRPARRPAYSVLSTEKAQAVLGRTLPPWEKALQQFMSSL